MAWKGSPERWWQQSRLRASFWISSQQVTIRRSRALGHVLPFYYSQLLLWYSCSQLRLRHVWVLRILRILLIVPKLILWATSAQDLQNGPSVLNTTFMSVMLTVDLMSLEHHLDGNGFQILLPILPILFDGTLAALVIVLGFWSVADFGNELLDRGAHPYAQGGFTAVFTIGIAITSIAILYRLCKELPAKQHLRHCYGNMEPTIMFTDAGDAIAVFPHNSSRLGLELAGMRSVDSLIQEHG